MNKTIYVIVFLLSFWANTFASFNIYVPIEDNIDDVADTTCITEKTTVNTLPSLSLQYYNDSNINVLERNYDFRLMNKKSKLEFWSNECKVFAFCGLLTVIGVNSWLASEYDWNLWIDVPCATVVAMGVFIPLLYASIRLQIKADAIKIVPITEVNINDDTTIGAVMYVDDFQQSKSFGVQLKTKF